MMNSSKTPSWRDQGMDPDYRFSLANERTFLAWIRTALALLAGALILHQLSAHLQLGRLGIWLVATLAVLAAVLSGAAFFRWRANEIAMRMSHPLPPSALLPLVSAVLATASIMAVLAFLLHHAKV
jgi:putative membrane protein